MLHPLGRNKRDVWRIAVSSFSGAHFATMPEKLAQDCILAGCPPDGVVLDMFAGAGTTLVAAKRLGRKYIGIELNPNYIKIINDRIAAMDIRRCLEYLKLL
jgi:DNA modification methylase